LGGERGCVWGAGSRGVGKGWLILSAWWGGISKKGGPPGREVQELARGGKERSLNNNNLMGRGYLTMGRGVENPIVLSRKETEKKLPAK